MGMTWFAQLFGFEERGYAATQAAFELEGDVLRSTVNGRAFAAGRFTTPTLAALRAEAAGLLPGTLQLRHEAIGDVLGLHALPENAGAMFQAASQFNCLEFASEHAVPERGVTIYEGDGTQGPACALAAAAGTVVRNYLAEVDGQRGQTRDRQINTLAGVLAALGPAGRGLEVRNGYTFADEPALRALGAAIAERDREALLGAIQIGVQADVGVTFASRWREPAAPQRVSQAYASALSCGYAGGRLALWAPLATLVLDAAYEATLLAAVIDAAKGRGSGRVWLTFLGGGVFRNDIAWITGAIARAVARVQHHALDVRVAHYKAIDAGIRAAIDAGPR